MLRVEEGDDQHAEDVVHNRQRGNKDFQPGRHPAPQQCQDAESEGYVGRHRDAPTIGACASFIDGDINQRRHH